MTNLYAIHDWQTDWGGIMRAGARSGWAVISESIGDDPNDTSGYNYRELAAYGVTPIVRLNYSHHGQGTIPLPDRYDAFAQRCANFVTASSGCIHWIIGNETNLKGEQPQGVAITPYQYARCFAKCRTAIKQRSGNPLGEHHVIVAAIAPYNVDTGWCIDYWIEMLDEIQTQGADGLALHFYSRGPDPSSITSTAKMDPPYQNFYNGFFAYRDLLAAVPASLRELPTYATETDQLDPWLDVNSGWVRAAYAEIDAWNRSGGQQIHCLALYRWLNHDRWGFCEKHGVIDDFRAALAYDYSVAPEPTPPGPEPEPEPEPPEPTPPDDGDYLIEWDPRLNERGVALTVAESEAGQWAWHCIAGEWFDKDEAQGRHNTYVTLLDQNGNLVTGAPVRWFWADGQEIKDSERKEDSWLGHPYSLDFGMYAVAPAYGVQVADGVPSDVIMGLGLGSIEQPHHTVHTSYSFTFRQITSSGPTPPTPPHTEYVTPLLGANLRDEPGQHGEALIAVPYAEAVSVYGSISGDDGYQWHAVLYQGYDGFIRADLLSIVQPEPVPEPEPPKPGTLKLIWPIRDGSVTNWFGSREIDYSQFGIESHDGIDIGAPQGTPVLCIASGVVKAVASEPNGFGLFVRVWHAAHGFHSLYAHLSEQSVQLGEWVSQGRQIGLVGSTGNSTGPHLHFCCRVGSESDYYRVHTGHNQGASDPMAIYAVINCSDPNQLI